MGVVRALRDCAVGVVLPFKGVVRPLTGVVLPLTGAVPCGPGLCALVVTGVLLPLFVELPLGGLRALRYLGVEVLGVVEAGLCDLALLGVLHSGLFALELF